MKHKLTVFFLLSAVFCTSLSVFSGCGKKTLPLPPEIKGQAIAAPFDLKYRVVDNSITLSWNHKIEPETAAVNPDGFEIFMAQRTFDACVGCPFEFKPAGAVSMPLMEFTMEMEKGFKYYFRVQAVDEDELRSEFSKTVQFEYK